MSRGYAAPQLPGYTFVDLIGQGGFADVFRYTQQRPSREVAVKVLTEAGLQGEARAQFDSEAELMAQLATHPSIVPIYSADVSGDGRPYLVMEYCSGPSLARRARTQPIPVPEVLEIAIQVSAAVETAHRAGILHRDVKPQNILTNAYGHPKLTDFGIAVVHGGGGSTSGVSIPWAPPELLGDRPTEDVRSDVYSLAATVHTLVAGRSPFEVLGGANDAHTLISRIERAPVPRLVRADVPELLQDVLQRAMSKDPAARPGSAIAFARSLQEVQIDLHLSPTRIDVLDASPSAAPDGEDDERTRVRPIRVIDPEGPSIRDTPVDSSPEWPTQHVTDPDLTGPKPTGPELTGPGATGPDLAPEVDQTRRRQPTPAQVAAARRAAVPPAARPPEPVASASTAGEPTQGSRSRLLLVAVGVLVVLALGATGIALLHGGSGEDQTQRAGLGADPNDNEAVPDDAVPLVKGVVVKVTDDRGLVKWVNPSPRDGDVYQVRVDGKNWVTTKSQRMTFRLKGSDSGCVAVRLVRGDRSSETLPTCPERVR